MALDVRRNSTVALGAIALLLVVSAAVGFARSDQSLRVAEDATTVQEAERARAAIATYRANLTFAVVAAAAVSESASMRALEASSGTLVRIRAATGRLDHPPAQYLTQALSENHQRISAALAGGDVSSADAIVSTETLPVLDDLQAELASVSGSASARIEAEQSAAGRTARLSSFVVALIAPMLALWAYRRAAQRRLERERLAAELERQRQLAETQQSLISGMSHQLRTPLTGIYGFAEAIVADADSPDPAFVTAAGVTILGEATRLRAMVDDILVTARAEAGDLAVDRTPFSISAEVIAAIEPFVATGASIEADCDPADLIGDRLRVRHVLRNLVDNALRHGAPPVGVVGRADDGGYTLTVIDHGNGPGNLDPAATFAHSGEDALVTGSLGLGLGVIRTLCDAMDVDIRHERDEQTTRFTLRFSQATRTEQPAGALSVRR
ncbi:MAG: histidine kinase dimerization/phospho-acceptor domain-containing protein [Acidimicrobiia bacterium]|nr:histidine kinase dimerization/phospho-acceptor domain-containing protein [Acidimicrobiia bacterium]